ncbi:restriction endonuclease subunit S [Pseudoalteromonas sp. SD03]|uniref:Restriction endonuclease subunit S n=1 Tax=Pseudoalteromonas sp. SD03 TaxID=3231719 RepID=A0AB39APB0_9GAMM|nr:restriction endonuclease subunit S [Pseudoalteromonas spiralis]
MSLSLKPPLRFVEFDSSWEKYNLSDLGEFKNGVNKTAEDFGHGMPFVNLMDVFGQNSIGLPELDLVNSTEKERGLYSLKKGDTLFIRSSVKRQGVGETAVCEHDIEDAVYSGFLIRFRSNDNIEHGFKRFCFWTPKFRNSLLRMSTTSANTNINQESLSKLKLALPTIEEQQKIADFLSSIDRKSSLLKEKHILLAQYKKGVMQQLFKQEIRFKDESGKAFPDWQEKTMNQVLSPEVREIPKPSKKYLALGIRSHMKGTFQKPDSDPEAIVMEKLFVVRPNDLVVNITFAWEGAIAIAKTEDDGGLVSHRFPTYTFKKNEATHRYFKHIIQLKRFKYMLDLISPGGAGRNRVLSKSEFLKLKWELPSVKEQEKIADFLDTLDNKLQAINEQIELTQTFKKGLLLQMFV